MKSETVFTNDLKVEVIKIKGEPFIKISITGVSLNNYNKPQTDWSKKNTVVVLMNLYSLPGYLKGQRNAIANWEKSQTEFIDHIKKAFMQPVALPEK